mgnify:CR=1 FL=1
MLLEIQAANAAFAIISKAISNGKELHDVAKDAQTYFDNKSSISKKANKNMALEKLREQEAHLKQVFIYAGRPGLYDDWLQYQAKAKRARQEAERLRAQKSAAIKRRILYFFTALCTVLVAVPVVTFLGYIVINLII